MGWPRWPSQRWSGVSESQAADAVAQALPEVVDRVSPDGELPPEQDLDAAFDKLAKAGAG